MMIFKKPFFSKQTKRKILLLIAPYLIWCVLWILYCLTRHRFYIDTKSLHSNFVGAFWHGEFLMLPFIYKQLKKYMKKGQKKEVYIIHSQHFDGEILARLCRLFGLCGLRGSSSKGGLKVLVDSIKVLESGASIGISPDGPKGPYHSIANGCIAMSMKTNVAILPIRILFSDYWELKTWDRLKIPKPFSTISYHALSALSFEPNLPIEQAKTLLSQRLSSKNFDMETQTLKA
ncbi:MAG: lysophospholipid acyltransferase family protein [Helicobacter sp.]|nr:lysophospholipid acyltransferase family protein [Helicobacter sp.]MCI7484375.1 lysophospholipid acyltransferase family protein [Helicobacter sp.]